MKRERDTPPGPTAVPFDNQPYVQPRDLEGLVDELTPHSESRAVLILARLVDLARATNPAFMEAMEARAARDRTKAAAWEALTTVLRSRWAGVALVLLSAALALGGLELVGFEMSALPAIISAARQCPTVPGPPLPAGVLP